MRDDGSWSFILVAAGAGSRIGGTPKQFRILGPDAVWRWSARVAEELFSLGVVSELVVVFPPGYGPSPGENKFSVPVRYVSGGETRTESVLNALGEASADFVMIHDAARPFLSAELCGDLAAALGGDPDAGAVPLLESADSLKLVDAGIHPFPREKIFRTQTPQAFRREDIKKVIESSGRAATDEATLWIESGRRLLHIPGSEKNFKITTNFDWAMARAIAESGREIRVGIGYDVHELVPGRGLILGGIEIESPLGLLGHSDADIISHAVADAVLGAAGMGDIGTMFPASDAKYKDAASMNLLAVVIDAVRGGGWNIVNVDIALKAQIPRMGNQLHIITENMKKLITSICPYAKINIKVKSGEGIGSVGRAECMECFAVAEIEKYEIERR